MTLKQLLFAVIFLAFTGTAFGQLANRIEITPFGGYMLGGKMKFVQGDLKVKDNATFGLAVAIPVQRSTFVEFYWSHADTRAEWQPFSQYAEDYPEGQWDVSIDYFQIGGLQQGDLGTGIVKGFGAFTVGAALFNPKDADISSTWRFAATLGGGLKIYPADRIGIRLQGRLLMPMYWGGSGFYCGIGTGGSGCGVGVSSYSMLVQGDFTLGLIIMIGD